MIGALYRTKKQLDYASLKKIYFAHIQSHLAYMITIWSNCTKKKLDELRRLQNKAIKIITNKNRLTASASLYTGEYQSLDNIIKTNQILLIQQIKTNYIRHDIFLQTNFEFHGYNTRRNHMLHNKGYSIIDSAIKSYNNIPFDMIDLSYEQLKTKIKSYVQQQQPT